MRAFLVSKAKEDNFIAYDGASNSSHAKQIRRLSLSTDRCPDEDVLCRARSLIIFGYETQLDGVPFKAFKKLRVLEIHHSSRPRNGHLVDICGLIWLKCLVLMDCGHITELPREIGRLQDLESLDVTGTRISKLPTEIGKLQHLETLDVSRTRVRELPKEIRQLQHLRTLDIRETEVRELPWEVENSINVLIGDFDSDKMVKLAEAVSPDWVISSSGANCRGALSIVFLDPFNPSLWKLVEKDLEFLKTQMPNLQALQLRFEVLPRDPFAITGGGFSKLETFYVDCRLPRVITFREGAMPKLKHLEFKFYTGTARQHYSMGIKHLDSLEKVVFRCSEYYTSDSPGIRETIDVLRKEAVEHPQEITLWVNDKPEVFGNRARKSEGLGLDIEKEFEEWEKQIERRATEIAAVKERIREQRLRLSTAAEGRAQRDKNNARAGIEKEIQERKSKLEIREQRLREEERYYNIK
ncbi:disease resistance protein Pik-1 [Setaria viridis]|nr:disease resistance protein Pik-1-like [Setaria viridis]